MTRHSKMLKCSLLLLIIYPVNSNVVWQYHYLDISLRNCCEMYSNHHKHIFSMSLGWQKETFTLKMWTAECDWVVAFWVLFWAVQLSFVRVCTGATAELIDLFLIISVLNEKCQTTKASKAEQNRTTCLNCTTQAIF